MRGRARCVRVMAQLPLACTLMRSMSSPADNRRVTWVSSDKDGMQRRTCSFAQLLRLWVGSARAGDDFVGAHVDQLGAAAGINSRSSSKPRSTCCNTGRQIGDQLDDVAEAERLRHDAVHRGRSSGGQGGNGSALHGRHRGGVSLQCRVEQAVDNRKRVLM
jgi:hypothetical protein